MSEETAWAAGLFEGEGSMTTHTKSRKLEMNSTDLDVLRRFHRIVGVGAIYGPKIQEGRKPKWRWVAGRGEEIVEVLERLLPYFGDRRSVKAMDMFSRVGFRQPTRERSCPTRRPTQSRTSSPPR